MIMDLTLNGVSHPIGYGTPCFIIAEAGVNHDGSLETARKLVEVAAQADVDAVKFQTFEAERMVTLSAPKADYQIQVTDASESQYDMLRRLELSPEMHQDLLDYCGQQGVGFMSTPFDKASADLLEHLGVTVFKIASGEITNLPFLAYVAQKGKAMIMSTGMASLDEVAKAVETIRQTGNQNLILLHCVSNYPADPADANLRAMHVMENTFGLPVGYSDHTPGIEVALAAVALGACVIEKHFTLDRESPGPDHMASLEPDELIALVKGIRAVELALGDGNKEPAESEANSTVVARKSLVAAQYIPSGTVITAEMITSKRPGTGLLPAKCQDLLGRTAGRNIQIDTILAIDMFE